MASDGNGTVGGANISNAKFAGVAHENANTDLLRPVWYTVYTDASTSITAGEQTALNTIDHSGFSWLPVAGTRVRRVLLRAAYDLDTATSGYTTQPVGDVVVQWSDDSYGVIAKGVTITGAATDRSDATLKYTSVTDPNGYDLLGAVRVGFVVTTAGVFVDGSAGASVIAVQMLGLE